MVGVHTRITAYPPRPACARRRARRRGAAQRSSRSASTSEASPTTSTGSPSSARTPLRKRWWSSTRNTGAAPRHPHSAIYSSTSVPSPGRGPDTTTRRGGACGRDRLGDPAPIVGDLVADEADPRSRTNTVTRSGSTSRYTETGARPMPARVDHRSRGEARARAAARRAGTPLRPAPPRRARWRCSTSAAHLDRVAELLVRVRRRLSNSHAAVALRRRASLMTTRGSSACRWIIARVWKTES